MKIMRQPSEYKGKKIKLKETSRTYMELQEEQDDSTFIIIEDWAENVLEKTNEFIKDRLYGHLDKSNLSRIVDLDELELD